MEKNWTAETVTEVLRTGIVSFEYKKSDGSIRSALGTLVPEMLPDRFEGVKSELMELASSTEEMTPYALVGELHKLGGKIRFLKSKTGEGAKPVMLVRYYDLQRRGFRLFAFSRFIGVRQVWEVERKE